MQSLMCNGFKFSVFDGGDTMYLALAAPRLIHSVGWSHDIFTLPGEEAEFLLHVMNESENAAIVTASVDSCARSLRGILKTKRIRCGRFITTLILGSCRQKMRQTY